jgi:predicted nuclease of predicted toxin-antitoxin system
MPEVLRLYLDQMFRVDVADALHDQGYNVVRVSETGHARADDQQILQKAISENRVLVTLDQHFGDWVVLPLSRHPGVIRLRLHPATSENVLKLLIPFLRLHTQEQFKDHLVILSKSRAKWILTA